MADHRGRENGDDHQRRDRIDTATLAAVSVGLRRALYAGFPCRLGAVP
jgi:hypothetical protein